MGSFENSLKRELGKNTGKFISNVIFGDRHSTPYRRVGGSNGEFISSADIKRAEIESRHQEAMARAEIERKNQLYAIDGAVLENIDALNDLDIPLEKEPLLQVLFKLSVLLKANKWESGNDEAKIRNKYTDCLLEKFRLAVQELEIIDPEDPHLNSYKLTYSKQKRRRFLKVHQSAIIALSVTIGGFYLLALAAFPAVTLSRTLFCAIAIGCIIGLIVYTEYLFKQKKRSSSMQSKNKENQPIVDTEKEIKEQSFVFFDLNKNGRIEKRLAAIWEKYRSSNCDLTNRKPLFAADGVRDSILFVGVNPAYDHKDDEIMIHSEDGESLMYGSFYQRDDAPEYFKDLEKFAASLGKRYTQINLLYVRENDRDTLIKSDEIFIREQLELTYETIRQINPVAIVFFTDYCHQLIFGAERWIAPNSGVDGRYILRGTNIPAFFSDDITILEVSQREALINKIRKAL